MATELLRENSEFLPQGVSSDCGATGRKASSDARTEEGNAREISKVTRGGAGGGFWSSVKLGSLFWPRWYKKVRGFHKKITLIISQGHLSGALTLWSEVWAWGHEWNLPQSFQQPTRIKLGNFILMLSVFKRQLSAVPNRQYGWGPTHWTRCTILSV